MSIAVNVNKQDQDGLISSILEPDGSSKEHKRNWARLIQKTYEVDPLTCPECFEKMKIISVIEDEEVIKKILKHLGLWQREARPPPQKDDAPISHVYIDYSDCQVPPSDDYLCSDPDYPGECGVETYAS